MILFSRFLQDFCKNADNNADSLQRITPGAEVCANPRTFPGVFFILRKNILKPLDTMRIVCNNSMTILLTDGARPRKGKGKIMGNFTQVGVVTLKEDKVFVNNSYDCAAWNETVLVKAGQYPVEVYNLRFYEDGKLDWNNGGIYITLPGTIVSDYFPTMYCGVPVGKEYDSTKNAGRKSEYSYHLREYEFAGMVANGGHDDYLGGEYELFPEYEAKEISRSISEYDGHEIVLHTLFKKI